MKKFMSAKNTVICVFVLYLGGILINQQSLINRQNQQMSEHQAELQRLVEENLILQDRVDEVNTDKYYEHKAKDNLGLINEGEVLIIDSSK